MYERPPRIYRYSSVLYFKQIPGILGQIPGILDQIPGILDQKFEEVKQSGSEIFSANTTLTVSYSYVWRAVLASNSLLTVPVCTRPAGAGGRL